MSHIIGMGNPLLDISVEVDQSFLDKYNLTCPNAILADESHTELYKEIVTSPYSPDYVAGGSCQNTVRVAQWLLGVTGATAFTGSVGTDAAAKVLTDCVSNDGVKPYYQINTTLPTGSCAVLIKNKDRSMVANLAAANAYKGEFIKENADLKTAYDATKIIAVEGYFLTVVPETVVELAKFSKDNGKIFAFSIAAPFICQFFTEPLLRVLENTDIVFGNEHEAEALAEKMNWADKSPKAVAIELSKYGRARTAVVTCGADDVIVATNGEVQVFPVPKLSAEEIVDANGAGDAFMGGYIASLSVGKDVATCVAAGIYCSQVILGTNGTKLSSKPTFSL